MLAKKQIKETAPNILGNGVYSLSEVARYVGAPYQRLYHWFREKDSSLFHSDFEGTKIDLALSFYDLIDSWVVVRLREHGFSFQKIRKIRDHLEAEWNTPHPFCMKRFYVDVSEKTLLHSVFSQDDHDSEDYALFESMMGQGQFVECINDYTEEIEFTKGHDSIARLWEIVAGKVIIDPKVQFGKPVIKGRRVMTHVLASQFYAYDEDAAEVARLFDVSEDEVNNAVQFERDKGTVKKVA